MKYKDYLLRYESDPNIFKDMSVKDDIINNSNKYELTWFCSDDDVTSQMIYDLLDDEGMNMLSNSSDNLKKVNGIIASGEDISKLYDNELFLELLVLLNDYYYYIDEYGALKLISYAIDKYPDRVVKIFCGFSESVQLHVISNCDLSSFYYELLRFCGNETSEYILNSISTLNDFDYDDLLSIFGRSVHVSTHLFSSEFIKKISTIYNVKEYRRLIGELVSNNDVSEFEMERKKFYDYFLANCKNIYNSIKKDINSGVDPFVSIKNHLNCFGGIDTILKTVYDSLDDIDVLIDRALNYITTDVVVDYLFQDISYNVFIDIRELVDFSSKTGILDKDSLLFYSKIISLDQMSIDEKILLLNEYKNVDIVSKFYDDYLCARRKMLELINNSILTSDNILKYKNDKLSNEYCVPIYELDGAEFYVFARNVGKMKTGKLVERDLMARNDGISYSIDGSSKLSMYGDINLYFAVAFDGIPKDQLVHLFEIDSFSKYQRGHNNIPIDGNGTDRINRLFIPGDLVEKSCSYDELIVSQPNGNNDEFNKGLFLPKPFAIYCYDKVTDADILNARANNLGIIVVRTDKYEIDKDGKVGMFSRENKEISYYNWTDKDDIWNRKL